LLLLLDMKSAALETGFDARGRHPDDGGGAPHAVGVSRGSFRSYSWTSAAGNPNGNARPWITAGLEPDGQACRGLVVVRHARDAGPAAADPREDSRGAARGRSTAGRQEDAGIPRQRKYRDGAASLATLILAAAMAASCATARWPVEGTMTSPFGIRFRGLRPEIHEGVDIGTPSGTPVTAMMRGRVVHAGPLGDYGLAIILEHRGRTRSLYAHLSAAEVERGQDVDGRQVIGRSGQSGNASGPHLHFEILRRGRPEDPVPLLGRRPRETVREPGP
jgi:murein DD-endopeptidase MepM/ murein hydrolase activator NlpD